MKALGRNSIKLDRFHAANRRISLRAGLMVSTGHDFNSMFDRTSLPYRGPVPVSSWQIWTVHLDVQLENSLFGVGGPEFTTTSQKGAPVPTRARIQGS